MTMPSPYKPRAPLRPPLRPAPSSRLEAVAEVRAAAVQDLLGPYLLDQSPLVDVICDELRSPVSRPRIVEFGCGTGHLTLAALSARRDAQYHAFESAEARVAVARAKLIRQGGGLEQAATFTAPFALDRRAIGEALQGLRADFLLLPRFLQTVPLCATEALHRVAFLAFCRQLVKPGGRMLIIEDVYGESADEQARLSAASRDAFRARLTAALERVRLLLRVLDPELAARLGRLPGDPALLAELERRALPAGAQVLPLTAWQTMFEHLGFTYRTVRHETQRQLCLFTVRC